MPPKMRPLKKSLSLTERPPSHPHEMDSKHRYFYTRSLSRSDKELGAILTLNRSLIQLKSLIQNDYGECTLIDIGTGDIYLSKSFDEEQGRTVLFTSAYLEQEAISNRQYTQDDRFIAAVKDFMERMLLRQKLLNRIARRLLRLSHAMDGKIQKALPPLLYKYGDKRMLETHEDYKENLKEFAERKQLEKEIMDRIQKRIQDQHMEEDFLDKDVMMQEERNHSTSMSTDDVMDPQQNAAFPTDPAHSNAPSSSSTSASALEVPSSSGYVQDSESGIYAKEGQAQPPVPDATAAAAAAASTSAFVPEGPSSSGYEQDVESGMNESMEIEEHLDPLLLNKEHQADLSKLIEFDSEYDKVKTEDVTTGTVKVTYAITSEEFEAVNKTQYDFDDLDKDIRYNIGSTFTSQASSREMAMEHKRWMTELLSKIPDQPTFEDLGMKNRVFELEKRKAFFQDMEESNAAVKEESEPNKLHTSDDDVSMEEDKVAVESDKKRERDFNRKKFCLEPVPSFHDQDYHRCLMIHNDLIQYATTEKAKVSVEEANREYQEAFNASSAVQNAKVAAEREKDTILRYYRQELHRFYDKRAMELERWSSIKEHFDKSKMNKFVMKMQSEGVPITSDLSKAMSMKDSDMVKRALAGVVDRAVAMNDPSEQAIGTQYIFQTIMHSFDPTQKEVSSSLAHVVDTVVRRSESGWVSDDVIDQVHGGEQYTPFNYKNSPEIEIPVTARGENWNQFIDRVTKQIEDLNKKLVQYEEIRAQKWSKLIKVQGEMDKAKQQKKSNRYSYSNAQTALQTASSVQQTVAAMQMAKKEKAESQSISQYQAPVRHVSSGYHPNRAAAINTNQGGLTTKNPYGDRYSADNVRARIGADGSVVPVSAPKKTSDGLYMRPAGRQRKGMEWDAVNGRWIPDLNFRP
jgi:hypothetical protein